MAVMLCDVVALLPLSFAALQDCKKRIIPDAAVLLIALCAAVKVILDLSAWWTSLAGGLLTGLTFLVFALVNRDALGGGDVKLATALGALLGAEEAFLVLAVALVILCVWGRIRKAYSLPFAPCVLAAVIAVKTIPSLIIFIKGVMIP